MERGRGAGGEGARFPGNPTISRAANTQTRRPDHSCLSSVVSVVSVFSVFSVVKKTPLTHHIAGADLGLESPSYVECSVPGEGVMACLP